MKKTLKQFLIFNFLFLIAACPVFAAKAGVSGVISNVIGSVQVQRADSTAWTAAKIGAFIYEGDSVKTLPRSRALISFTNGVEARLHANTTFKVIPGQAGKKAEGSSIKMNMGKLWTKVLKQKTKFDIKTPVATISVRGTEYETDVAEAGNTTVRVYDGEVDVGNELGSCRVRRGQMNNTDPGNAPGDAQNMGDGDRSNWQDEIKSVGSIKIELAKSEAKLNEAVDGKLTVYDSKGKVDQAYAKELQLSCDNSDVAFSRYGEDKWNSALGLTPGKGEARFRVKSGAGGLMNISVTGEKAGASMATLDVKLPPNKDLRIKVKDADGREKEILLKFKAK